MRSRILFFIIGMVVFLPRAYADDCLSYKLNPSVYIKTPTWSKTVVQPLKPMDLWHGNVIATLVDNYEITGDITSIEDGFCVGLKTVDILIGYSDFNISIDSRHAPESCAYNAILLHEDEHIRTYLSVIDDYKEDIVRAVYSAAKSIMPIYILDESNSVVALDTLNKQLQLHPDLILIKQKIHTEQEIRNKRIDQVETGAHLKNCF